MANQEHLDIFRQGVEIWNLWRQEHPSIRPDLSWANLSGATLNEANLSKANLSSVILYGANLREAKIRDTDLTGADLSDTDLRFADLKGTDLRNADLGLARLSYADLSGADLSGANLCDANLNRANLSQTNLSKATVGSTQLDDIDLSTVKGLKTVQHISSSSIGFDTIIHSQGHIPDTFLRGAGLDNTFIGYIHTLVSKPIQYYTCFICHSSKDQDFVERLYADLQTENVRCWYAPEDLKIGDKFRTRIDEAIRLHDKLLLVLSEHSINSPWVEKEVETAFEKEQRQNRLALFPVKVDHIVMQTEQAWAADIRRTRHIGDFTSWKEHNQYQQAFARLLGDLKNEGQVKH